MLISGISNNTVKTYVPHNKAANVSFAKLTSLAEDKFEKISFKGGEYEEQMSGHGFSDLDLECESSFVSFLHRGKQNAKKPPLSKFSKFDVEEYKSLGWFEKRKIRKELDSLKGAEKIANLTTAAAEILKEEYDKKYGEGNYVYISIGRSCSSVAKALEYMGIESKIAPMSRLMEIEIDKKKFLENEGLDKYIDFLHNMGLSPKEVKNSGKHYIFQDYTSSGKSLRAFEELMRSEKVGLDLENVHFESINEKLFEITQQYKPRYPDFNEQAFIRSLSFCNCKKYSVIGKLDYWHMGDVLESLHPIFKISEDAKVFNFALMDRLNRLGLLPEEG